MDSIPAYLTIMIQGIRYNHDKLLSVVRENDRLMTHYASWVPNLLGSEAMSYVRGNSKACMCGSPDQCVRYFHDLLGYPVVLRSPKTGEPSLGKRAMFKLRLKHKNPLIDICLAYRETSKESGSLKFIPWKAAPAAEQKELFSNTQQDTSLLADLPTEL